MYNFSTGALKSKRDKRTIQHKDIAFSSINLTKGGIEYQSRDIEHQHKVGICTAISLIQLIQKKNGKKYNPDFQYLLQKKFYDKNWTEGSSIFNALKVGKEYGFLPLTVKSEYLPTEEDRLTSYNTYIAKLKSIPNEEIERLKKLCIDNIKGYSFVKPNDSQDIASAINDSSSGILCRYDCGSTWWLPSWLAKDINPLKKPNPATSGHAIIMNMFDYSVKLMQKLANTWGITWCLKGCADINWDDYKPTECWKILDFNPMYQFSKIMAFGMRDPEVKELQKRLGVIQTGYFGILTRNAVKKYQKEKGLVIDGIVGKKTIAMLNR